MRNTSSRIEQYLKELLDETGTIEIQRRQMAQQFDVVPSQINYVINTRFTLSKGYAVESKRGGGGYIRIVKVTFSDLHDLLLKIMKVVDDAISETEANGVIRYLYEEEILSKREAKMMMDAVSKEMIAEDSIRAKLLLRFIARVDAL